MKRRMFRITGVYFIILLTIAGIFWYQNGRQKPETDNSDKILLLNEIEQLTKSIENETDRNKTKLLYEKIQILSEKLRNTEVFTTANNRIWFPILFFLVSFLFVCSVFLYVYFEILKPFHRMERYAGQIASGNFEFSLDYDRSNYFGAFTFAFDEMRCEIIRSRSREQEAIESNKTIIATLSHDIKTPISSIRAYAEGLDANLDTTLEKRSQYTKVIIRKCDEVAKLTNDLFLHSISNLEQLSISLRDVELNSFLQELFSEQRAAGYEIEFQLFPESVMVSIDKKRFEQVIENIVSNAKKYAKTKLTVWMELEQDSILLFIRDYGKGLPDTDVPFVFDKFYRGKNCGTEQGSGLGLFITKYILIHMNGEITLHNHIDGLCICIRLPKVKSLSIS